ncbi:MAG: InlB B-repeat-containing protein, partial [Clostridia bacterium]|nr:InlB B-repeat-containing protein [Clostridia bacterium]
YNTTIIYFDVVWADVGADWKDDTTITNVTMSTYSDKYSDVTFTITANKTGHTLTQVYATYTSGDISGQKIALEQIQAPNSSNVSKWILYGICGNCKISTEWLANTYSITYSINSTYGTIATKGLEKFTYGVGISYTELSTVTNKTGYVFKGWSTSGNATDILTAAASGTTVLASKTANVTLTALFQSSKAITTRSSTTSMTSLSDVESWTSTSSYVTSGQGISYSSTTNNLVGTYFSWGNKHVTYTAPAGLYWCYHSNTDQKQPIGTSSPVTGDDTSIQGYAHYYIALAGDAMRAYRAGVPVTIAAEISYSVGCYASGSASKNCTSQVILGLQQGFTSGSTMSNTKNGTQKKGADNKSSWQTATGSLSQSITLTNNAGDLPGATIQIRANQTCTKGSTAEYISYAGVTAVKYKITYGGTVNTFTLYGNNGKTADNKTSVTITSYGSTSKITIPTNFFTREGYEFLGWNTSAATSANATYAPGKALETTSSAHSKA